MTDSLWRRLAAWLASRRAPAADPDIAPPGANDPDESTLIRALNADPHDSGARLRLAKIQAGQGQVAQAERTLLQGLEVVPDDANCLFGLGNLLRMGGDSGAARQRYEQALKSQPEHALSALGLAQLMLMSGEDTDAQALLRRALELQPGPGQIRDELVRHFARRGRWREIETLLNGNDVRSDADALHWLAHARHAQGDSAGAEALWRSAHLVDQADHRIASNLGRLLVAKKSWAEAAPLLEIAHAARPDDREDQMFLAVCRQMQDEYRPAIALYENLLESEPAHLGALTNLGVSYYRCARPADAAVCFERAIESGGRVPELLRKLAVAYAEIARDAEAEALAREALERSPSLVEAYAVLGLALQNLGRVDEAEECYNRLFSVQPEHADVRWYRSRLRLSRGDFEHGWDDFEWRWHRTAAGKKLQTDRPPWRGEPLDGKRILVYGEQGIGDEIMFASCVPDIAGSARITLLCRRRLVGMFARSFPGAVVDRHAHGDVYLKDGGHAFDYVVPAGDLPCQLRRSAGAFPAHRGYLRPDPVRVDAWRARLARLGPGLKVGLSWRGGTGLTRRDVRSMSLEDCLPLLEVAGATFVSLQYTECESEIADLYERHGIAVHHWPDAISDYEETAALAAALDLVTSVCTAVVHLSGALGRDVFVMAPFSAEWRYMYAGETMPWYPSVRIFRQDASGRWPPVTARVATVIAERVAIASEN